MDARCIIGIMDSTVVVFEKLKRVNEYESAFWSARALARTLGYSEYRHFIPVIERAKEACKKSGQPVDDHFEDVLEMIELGKTASRKIEDIKVRVRLKKSPITKLIS